MRLLDKYIISSSVFALFTEALKFHYIIDWKLFYIIILSNFLLIAINKKITIHKNMLVLFLFLLVHGVIGYLFFQNPIKSLIAQFIGIFVSSVYYHNFIKNYGVKIVFDKYLKFAFIIAVLSLFLFYLNIGLFIPNRLNGILSEPAHYAAIMLPAVYVFFKQKEYVKFIIILLTVLLSKSSIGYIGLLLMLLIPLLQIQHLLKYSLITLFIIMAGGYYLSTKWDDKTDENNNVVIRRIKGTQESLNAAITGKFNKNINLSTYAFMSNVFITKNIFLEKPFGTGLGSYPFEYDKYYHLIEPPPYLKTLKLSKINRTDANSLFLRGLSDFGVFWLFLMLFFLYKSVWLFKNNNTIRQSTFFYLAIKLLREGHYFPPEFYFFLLIFLNKFDEDIAYS